MDNIWTNYITRSYEQIKDALLERAGIEIPELTDHNDSNIFTKLISMWSGLMEMLGYYVDNAARESLLISSRRYVSMLKHAFNADYSVHYNIAATADVLFKLNAVTTSDITIPLGTIVKTEDGLKFETLEEKTILTGEIEIIIPVAQYSGTVQNLSLGISDGSVNQTFVIPSDTVADKSVMISVNSAFWEKQKTLGFSKSTEQHFTQTVTIEEDGQRRQLPLIQFGDNFTGKIPPAGSEIFTTYKTTEGLKGNRAKNTITMLVTNIPLPSGVNLSITNLNRISNGDDIESLDRLRYRIPRAIRTLQRAVTKLDFKDITEIVGGVAAGYVDFNCGKKVTVYVSPIGGGIASNDLINKVTTALNAEDTRIVTTFVTVLPAGEVIIELKISITALPQYLNTFVSDGVKSNLIAFLSPEIQEIYGTVELSDIYEVIENTVGVANSNISIMRALPYARPYNTQTPLEWSITVNANNSNTNRWRIRIINGNKYQLFRDNSFIGNYDLDVVAITPEMTLTVTNNSYVLGDTWEFVTYPYFGTVELSEPSIPISRTENIILNVTGGL